MNQEFEDFAVELEKKSLNSSIRSDVATQHFKLCIEQIEKFIQRPGLDPVGDEEKQLVLSLMLIQDALNNNVVLAQLMESKLMRSLAELVAFFATMSDLMIKDLSKACALETLLCFSEPIEPQNVLTEQLEMDAVPNSLWELFECRNVLLEHPHECECLECIEGEDAVAQEAIPPQFRKPSEKNTELQSDGHNEKKSELQMACGQDGKVVWPQRCLQYHKAAICCVNSYWRLLEFRSNKIAEFVDLLDLSEPLRQWVKAGEIVVVASKELSWISYEPTCPTAPCLPKFVRAYVLMADCPLPLKHGYRALWLPDYAARALCMPNRLIPVPLGNSICSWKPLVYIGSAYPPPPIEILSCVVNIIFTLMNANTRLDDFFIILEGKGPWRAYQLIKSISGQTRVEYLAILNMLAAHNEKGNRGLIACCIHNFLADWLVWLIHTQKASNEELNTLMDGINLYLPKIEVKRWPKSRLVFGAVNALLKCSPHEKLHQKLLTCIQSLTWDTPGRYNRNVRRRNNQTSQEPRDQQEGKENLLCDESILKEKNEQTKAHLSLEVSSISDFTMIRKQWPGETWLLPSRATVALFAESKLVLEDSVDNLIKSQPTMLRGMLYKGATQGLHCELMKAKGIRDIRQPAFSKIVCGMLNIGGGDIWIGLGQYSKVEGVYAHRAERDSFSQGILDVATYNIEPRLLPFNLEIEQILVLDKPGQELHPDRNRYIYRILVKPTEGVNYIVLPDKAYLSRREDDGATIVLL